MDYNCLDPKVEERLRYTTREIWCPWCFRWFIVVLGKDILSKLNCFGRRLYVHERLSQ